MAAVNACAKAINSVSIISHISRGCSAPCSNDEAAATAKVGRREALALIKIEGPAGTVVDAAGTAGLALKRFVHVDV
jgi:hypothetical protein